MRNETETFPLSARNVDQSATVTTGCVTDTVKVSACARVALGSVIRVALRTSRSHRDRINRRVVDDVIAVN